MANWIKFNLKLFCVEGEMFRPEREFFFQARNYIQLGIKFRSGEII